MTNSIPASALINVTPNVLSAGGSPLSLNTVMLSHDPSIPLGSVLPFPTLTAVQNWFGANSAEAALAAVYFAGYDNSSIKPGNLIFAQYNAAPVAAFLRSASVGALSLPQLQALSGVLTVTIDGTPHTSTTINLSGATSFTNAATLIQSALGSGVVTYDTQRQAFVITSSTTGASSTISYGSGTLAPLLYLTQATGATVSPGGIAATPAAVLNSITAITQNWGLLMTVFEPVLADKLAFSTWIQGTNLRYAYVGWDSDVTALQAGNTTSFGPQVLPSYEGIIPVWGTADKAAFICGMAASIDFNETNGRINFAYKGQGGLIPDVTDAVSAANLKANGYNFYGAYATAAQQFQFLQPGQISGRWDWIDPYLNQIFMNSQFQLALMEFLTGSKSVPYNDAGTSGLRSALLDPINQALNFGAIRAGVALSAAQISQVNTAAGVRIDSVLSQQGWYLQILPASAQVRGLRGSPPMKFWYTDGGSVNSINLNSIDVQ